MKSRISLYAIILVAFLIVYSFWISSTFNQVQLSYDESRHAAGGMIWHDYILTLVNDGYVHFSDYVNQYQKMGYNAGWFVNQDPAFDGIIRAIFYFIFGPTFFAIRFMALFSAIVSAILLYIIGCHITQKKSIALAAAIIMLMSTLFYMYTAIQALAPIPIIMMALFWYYFTFVREPKKSYRIKLFKEIYVEFNWGIILGGLFLTLATLIQYAAALFIDIFFVFYVIYLLISHYLKIKKNPEQKVSPSLISESGALQIIFVAFLQNLVFLLISYKWLKYNLFEMHWLERIKYYTSHQSTCLHDLNYLAIKYPWLGSETWFSNLTYMIHGYLQRTLFFTIFFGYALYLLFKKKIEDENLKKHLVIIALFFLAIYLYFSFRMSNHQIRYIPHVFPLVILISAYGLYRLIWTKFKKHQSLVFAGAVILFIVALFITDSWMFNRTYAEFGPKNEELLEFLQAKPSLKFLIHAPGTKPDIPSDRSWLYNPDLVMFTFMRVKEGYNPFIFSQQGQLFEYQRSSMAEVDSASKYLVQQLKSLPPNLPIYVVMYRFYEPEFFTAWGHNFLENGFSVQNLTYWTIYYRE